MGPDGHSVLGSLQLIAAPSRDVACRAERVRQRIELRRVGEFVRGVDVVDHTEPVVDSRRPLVNIEVTRGGGNEILSATAVRRGVERQQAHTLLTPQ